MNALTENELIALEAFARYGHDKPISGAAEVLHCLRDRGIEADAQTAQLLYSQADNLGIVALAYKLLPIHKQRAGAELATRVPNITKEQADRIIAALPKPKDETPAVENWSSTAARKWLMSYARSLSNEAKYIRENADGFAENEEEFRCGLANGLGIDDEDEQTEIIEKIHEGKTHATKVILPQVVPSRSAR